MTSGTNTLVPEKTLAESINGPANFTKYLNNATEFAITVNDTMLEIRESYIDEFRTFLNSQLQAETGIEANFNLNEKTQTLVVRVETEEGRSQQLAEKLVSNAGLVHTSPTGFNGVAETSSVCETVLYFPGNIRHSFAQVRISNGVDLGLDPEIAASFENIYARGFGDNLDELKFLEEAQYRVGGRHNMGSVEVSFGPGKSDSGVLFFLQNDPGGHNVQLGENEKIGYLVPLKASFNPPHSEWSSDKLPVMKYFTGDPAQGIIDGRGEESFIPAIVTYDTETEATRVLSFGEVHGNGSIRRSIGRNVLETLAKKYLSD